ncbi:MAG: hypothetical protein MK196_11210 [Acidimicrobiales bacterium]|nr:hypothetical protein [Acidimicrobiales bacterium]
MAVESVCFYGEDSPAVRHEVESRIGRYHRVGMTHAATSLEASVEAGLVVCRGSRSPVDIDLQSVDLTEKGLLLAVSKGWTNEGSLQWDRVMGTDETPGLDVSEIPVSEIPEVPEESNEDEVPEASDVDGGTGVVSDQDSSFLDARDEAAKALDRRRKERAEETPEVVETTEDTEDTVETPSSGLTFGTAEEGSFVKTSTGKLRLVVKVGKTVRVVRQTPRGDFASGHNSPNASCVHAYPSYPVRVEAYRVLSQKDLKRLGIEMGNSGFIDRYGDPVASKALRVKQGGGTVRIEGTEPPKAAPEVVKMAVPHGTRLAELEKKHDELKEMFLLLVEQIQEERETSAKRLQWFLGEMTR